MSDPILDAALINAGMRPSEAADVVRGNLRVATVSQISEAPDLLASIAELGLTPNDIVLATLGETAVADPEQRRMLDLERAVAELQRKAGVLVPALRKAGYG